MAVRILLALVGGLALGIIAAAVAFALTKPGDTAPAKAFGDPNAPYDLAVTITESFFTSQVNSPPTDTTGVDSRQTNLQDAQMRLREDGTIEVAGKTSLYGFTVPIRATVQPRVANGKLEMDIVSGQAGGLPVPASVADDIETVINRQLANTLAKQNFQIVALLPSAGALVVHLK